MVVRCDRIRIDSNIISNHDFCRVNRIEFFCVENAFGDRNKT